MIGFLMIIYRRMIIKDQLMIDVAGGCRQVTGICYLYTYI
jgi:hypothetical protein